MDISMENLRQAFEADGYICGQEVITTVYLALRLEKPLLITGAPGVGKTELAKVLSRVFNTELIRLQCYEGLDENKALYEWNYQKQLIKIQLSKGDIMEEDDLFSSKYLLERPLLKAIRSQKRPVLLIDEIDKTDEEFEAFLFELLSDFQVSIPELGTIKASQIPIVVLTSNGERELSDGLKRRCIFLYIDYPSVEKEIQIIKAKVPGVGERLTHQVAAALHFLRKLELKKKPAISETLDWARSLLLLKVEELNPAAVEATVNVLFKDQDDINTFKQKMGPETLVSKTKEYGSSCRC